MHPRPFVADFDGTTAETFAPSPAGMDVHRACGLTVRRLFGPVVHELYLTQGGLRNRAPSELITDLMPGASPDEQAEMTAHFTTGKLDLLLGEIGTRFADGRVWPQPVDGYLETLERIEAAREAGATIDDIILSSGHDAFIRATYQAWQVAVPSEILATEAADAEWAPHPAPVKPAPELMDWVLRKWRNHYTNGEGGDLAHPAAALYVGDDPVKDGQLAASRGVPFVLIDRDAPRESWQRVSFALGVGQRALKGRVYV